MKNQNNLRQVQEQNIYLIKSMQDQKLIGLQKNGNKFQFSNVDLNCEKLFNWIIQSEDQNEQHYEFRFGELVIIQNLARNIPFNKDKVSLLLQFYNETIDSQVFNKCSNNLIGNQPCVLKNTLTDLYLNIENFEITFGEQPFYFQIIHAQKQRNLFIERPICNLLCDYSIRNYFTGYQLTYSIQFETEKYLTTKSSQTNPQEKWRIFEKEKNNFQIFNLSQKSFVNNLQIDQSKESSQIFLSSNSPKNGWRIICPQNKQITFGIPFLIQDISSGYFFNIDMFNPRDDEFVIVLKKNIETTSLWVVFNMK